MANVSLWSKVAVAVQSALASPITINSITKASPAVVGYTGTDPANGEYIVVTAQGMNEVDGRVFRIANVNGAANTLELEGVDSTLFATFSSGSFQVITFGTTLATLTGLSSSGGEFNQVDITTIHDDVSKSIPGLASAIVYSFESIWDPADAGLVALKTASDQKAKRAMRFTFANGQKVVFNGYIGYTGLPGGNAQDRVTTQVQVTMESRPSTYAT